MTLDPIEIEVTLTQPWRVSLNRYFTELIRSQPNKKIYGFGSNQWHHYRDKEDEQKQKRQRILDHIGG